MKGNGGMRSRGVGGHNASSTRHVCPFASNSAWRIIFQKVIQLAKVPGREQIAMNGFQVMHSHVLPTGVLLDDILHDANPLVLPTFGCVRTFLRDAVLFCGVRAGDRMRNDTRTGQELLDVLERVLNFGYLGAHRIVEGGEVDRVAPVVVDGDACREVLHLVVPPAWSTMFGISACESFGEWNDGVHEDRFPGALLDDDRAGLIEVRKARWVDVSHVVCSFEVLFPTFAEEQRGLLWRKEPPPFAPGDICRPRVGRVDVAMERRERPRRSHVDEAKVIVGACRVVRVHPVIAEDVRGCVERLRARTFAFGCRWVRGGRESTREVPVFDVERLALALLPEGNDVAEEHPFAFLVAEVARGAIRDGHFAPSVGGFQPVPVY